jgi:hypothetical protein
MRRHPSRLAGAPRLLAGATVAVITVGLAVGPASAAFADPSTTPSAGSSASAGAGGTDKSIGPQTPGEVGCALPTALNEVTGMVVTQAGVAVIEGHNDNPTQVKIQTLDQACKATLKTWTGGVDPVDPQDLAVASDGSYVLCDCGDSDGSRPRIAIEKAPAGGGAASIYRFKYPNGSLNAQAMLLTKADLPIIFAQETGGKTGIYTAAAMPPANTPTEGQEGALTRAGEFTPKKTNTPNPKGAVGEAIVTGAAKSADGKHVVVRTFSDAYEYNVGDDGDIVNAILNTKPNVTPLPNEPQGEAIAYTADGAKFITLSVMPAGATETPKLLTYARYIAPEETEEPAPTEAAAADEGGFLSKFTFSELTRIIAAVGVVGLVLAIAGIIGIRRARRRRREEEDEYDDYDDYDERRGRRGRGRGRDDYGYGGPREPAYSAGYDDHAGYGGYNGYGGGGGYADSGYGGQQQQGYGDYGGQQQGYGGYGGQQQQGYGDYGGQQGYGDYGGQGQYGGYGYEEDFDPMQDPRRR